MIFQFYQESEYQHIQYFIINMECHYLFYNQVFFCKFRISKFITDMSNCAIVVKKYCNCNICRKFWFPFVCLAHLKRVTSDSSEIWIFSNSDTSIIYPKFSESRNHVIFSGIQKIFFQEIRDSKISSSSRNQIISFFI